MPVKLQLANCSHCKGYILSTIINTEDKYHPLILNHYLQHGESRFTLDKKIFDRTVSETMSEIQVVNFKEHLKNQENYCTCNCKDKGRIHQFYDKRSSIKTKDENTDQDVYFYDLYLTYNNFHQDIPTRQAI
ncbi:hypothetical protein [Chryseobacterium sp. FH1]|uniref:hypothetical protein n=1 Tax=Chryseobacterium sp. FH1 TaxID=1233951 RepID=UPI0004E3DFB5|nr:hypothetical protein [Chryseobacterium sp. FH1]KFC19427.1 hypothetical protein IO90_09020 [Chryseobacterium sp. FH1]